jgi:hypothetical protein
MSGQLVMAGPRQPVVHSELHDLESLFYVLVGMCVMFEGPMKVKPEVELAKCYDQFFNTFKPSILKTIAIQSDLTWTPSIIHHIHPYFNSLIPLLNRLRAEIILPLATTEQGDFYHKTSCDHDTFIKHIVTALSELQPKDWDDTSLKVPKSDNTSHIIQSKSVLSAAELLGPPTVPKDLPPGRGVIRSDSALVDWDVRRRARDDDSDDYVPSSSSKRPRLQRSHSNSSPPNERASSASPYPMRRITRQNKGLLAKTFGQ